MYQSPISVLKNILDLYRCLNSLEIDKLGAREDLCELGSSLVTEAATGEAAIIAGAGGNQLAMAWYIRVPHPPAPLRDTLKCHYGMLLNSLQIADLGVREHREQLPPHFRGDTVVSRHAVRRREG